MSTRFSLSMEMSRLTRDGTAEPVSRDQILRHARGQGNIIFPVQLTTSRIGNLTRLIHTLLYVMTIHRDGSMRRRRLLRGANARLLKRDISSKSRECLDERGCGCQDHTQPLPPSRAKCFESTDWTSRASPAIHL